MHPVFSGKRVITATSLFDGHDVSINIFRRLLQAAGLEVIHLGHNRSVLELVTTAIEEDGDAILVSSYQGGHREYFQHLIDMLRENGADHVQVFGGGGGVILPAEIRELETYGVCRLYHSDEGRRLGPRGIVQDILTRMEKGVKPPAGPSALPSRPPFSLKDRKAVADAISLVENNPAGTTPAAREAGRKALVIGLTGTGGSGKSSLVDELVHRFVKVLPGAGIGILAVDPTKSVSGGALLGDRIRMNAIYHDRVYMRSFATRGAGTEVSAALAGAIGVLESSGFDVILVETSGIGQGDSRIKAISDCCLYVMTQEFGAPTQLEKIDMLDLADFVVLNKCLKPGSEDALRELYLHRVKTQGLSVSVLANRSVTGLNLPIFATEANRFNDPGVNALFLALLEKMKQRNPGLRVDTEAAALMPVKGHKEFPRPAGSHGAYLDAVAGAVEKYHERARKEAQASDSCYCLKRSGDLLGGGAAAARAALEDAFREKWKALLPETRRFIEAWPGIRERYSKDEVAYTVRGREIRVKADSETLSGTRVPKVALPDFMSWGELTRFFYKENLPGFFPFTAGVFPFKRTFEDPKRQFAGEGTPEKANKRFHYLCRNEKVKRLSVAFDPLTLYGENPAERPDIFGKIGESGVSVPTLDDMIRLFRGFDLSDPLTSVSMTINAPAPVILAMYFMAAVRQAEAKTGRSLSETERIAVFQGLRGTVQADILKEDQGQNTCIFSLDFALRMMGDVQLYFAENRISDYYTVSISGYHIAEAGANPVTQLAFTLSNAFQYVETFLSLGLPIDKIAKNFSFFFSNGMEPEYSVIGRVARRIWAVALREHYGASESSQKLKYHIQTSGRALHAQECELNDIRTCLQALYAFYDNCNSLHTNSFDEAVTIPTEDSVRRAMAVQVILSKEFGMSRNENPNQGSFIVERLTDLVEKAVLEEFRRISSRGGVLGAIEKQYQRSRIQEESLYYEELKHSGQYPIFGVNTDVKAGGEDPYARMEVRRATTEDKEQQLENLRLFEAKHQGEKGEALARLERVIRGGGNIFAELLNTVQSASLGEITALLYAAGGKYRRNM